MLLTFVLCFINFYLCSLLTPQSMNSNLIFFVCIWLIQEKQQMWVILVHRFFSLSGNQNFIMKLVLHEYLTGTLFLQNNACFTWNLQFMICCSLLITWKWNKRCKIQEVQVMVSLTNYSSFNIRECWYLLQEVIYYVLPCF